MNKLEVGSWELKGTIVLIIMVCAFCIVNLSGCVGFKEGLRGFRGVSTKILEDNLPSAISQTFNGDYNSCQTKVKNALASIGAYIYAQDNSKKLIAIYVSQQDTTPVGIFFEESNKNQTKILVSSPSVYAKELIAEKIFSALGKSPK